ncbi:Mss4-like protein [Rhypophila decipiens]|uniref:Mss4-like protein n=1 Tax=Rhypophila decipiens TaxID=261697 RepID=A0AAN6Y4S0_9PEZI|nr:Mss4-like protein [Rhypophila decipiens]
MSSSTSDGPLTGSCHCGRISITIPSKPSRINQCHCTVCYKLGALWGYFPKSSVTIIEKDGATRNKYLREDLAPEEFESISFDSCSVCGTLTNWSRAPAKDTDEHAKMGVNMRVFGEVEKVMGDVPREIEYC